MIGKEEIERNRRELGLTNMYCEKKVVDKRDHGNPRPRLTRDGYTKKAGSPTRHQVKLEGETRWRRVYVWQFSNAGTTFILIDGQPQIISL